MEHDKNRPDWNDYFLTIAAVTALRSPDPNTKHGCIIVNESKKIVGTGYNGQIKQIDSEKIDWSRPNKYQYVIHAEENAILNSLVIPNNNFFHAYVTGRTCLNCLQRLIQFGVYNILFLDRIGTKLENEEEIKKQLDLIEKCKTQINFMVYNQESESPLLTQLRYRLEGKTF